MQERSMSTTRFLDLFNGIMGIAKNHCNQNIQIQNTNLITITNMPGGSLNFSLETLSKIKEVLQQHLLPFSSYTAYHCVLLASSQFLWKKNISNGK